jgi:4-amino-4-deoxy-L-arabinose transferase-like glycosyltransferase
MSKIEKAEKTTKLKKWLNHTGLMITAICLIALTLRLLALWSLKNSLYADVLLWDERSYHDMAVKLVKQSFHPSVRILFIYAYGIAFIYKLFGINILYIRVLNVFCGMGTCFLLCLIGKELLNRKIGLLAGLAAAMYTPFIFYDITVLNASITVLLFALSVYLLIKFWQTETWLKIFFLGLTAGLLYHFRPNAILIFPVLIWILIFKPGMRKIGLKRTALICLFCSLGFVCARAHILLNTQNRHLAASVNASQAGVNFYLGNYLGNPDPYYRPVPFSTSEPRMQGVYFKIEAERRAGHPLSTQEASNYWIKEVFRMAWEKPLMFAKKQLLKLLALCNRFEACDHYDIGFMSPFVPFFKWPLIPFWVVFPLGMAGLIWTFRASKIRQALAAVFCVYAATLIIFFTNARYRLPFLVFLIPFGLLGLESFFTAWKQKQWRAMVLYLGVIALFSVLEFLPIPGAGDLTAYYNTHALILNSKGRRSEALSYWEQSSRMNTSFAVFADLSLAGHAIREGRDAQVFYYLDKIPDRSFAAAQKYELLGDMRMRQNSAAEAADAFEKSLVINAGQARVFQKLIRLYEKTDPPRAKEKLAEFQKIFKWP